MPKFRLLQGHHVHAVPKDKVSSAIQSEVQAGKRRWPTNYYKAGDVIECDLIEQEMGDGTVRHVGLDEMFNGPVAADGSTHPNFRKFERVDEVAEAARMGFASVHEMDPTRRRPDETAKVHADRLMKLAQDAARAAEMEAQIGGNAKPVPDKGTPVASSLSPQESLVRTLDTLRAMSLKELQQWCASEEIDVSKVKQDVPNLLRHLSTVLK